MRSKYSSFQLSAVHHKALSKGTSARIKTEKNTGINTPFRHNFTNDQTKDVTNLSLR